MKENETVGAFKMPGLKGNGGRIAVEKYKCKRPFWRPEHGW
jgi:hypothetical protein